MRARFVFGEELSRHFARSALFRVFVVRRVHPRTERDAAGARGLSQQIPGFAEDDGVGNASRRMMM